MRMAALRHRNFRLLFAGRAISFFGTNVVPVALAFAALDVVEVRPGDVHRDRHADENQHDGHAEVAA